MSSKFSIKLNVNVISAIKSDESGFLISHGDWILRVHFNGSIDTLFAWSERVFDFLFMDDELFFTTLGRVQKLNAQGVVELLYEENLLVPPRHLIMANDSTLWFSQKHTGLVKTDLSSPTFSHTIFGHDEGVISQVINSMIRYQDQLMLSGGYCMLSFDLISESVSHRFTYSDGPVHFEFLDVIHALDDQNYFTTDLNGILVFSRQKLQDPILNVRVQYWQVRNESRRYDSKLPIRLSYRDNDLSILLETCYFGDANDLQYAYKLEENGEWIELGASPLMNFTNLSPDLYTIYAAVRRGDMEYFEIESPISVRVLPPWWQTVWFRCILAGIILAGIYFFYRYRIVNLKKKYSMEKKLLELEQVALKSQMNPHFLFNCLNGIRTLIQLKEEDQAVAYVNHLSTLLRDTLLHHEDTRVSLEKELTMMENYLTLGKLRFGDKIQWALIVSSNIDSAKIFVPPFLLQPLVENAMWHGIKHLDGPGHIDVIVEREFDQIVIRILDNGIGLKKAMALQESQLRTRKHIGLSLVRKRLEAIDSHMIVRDRKDVCGVEVIIYINPMDHV